MNIELLLENPTCDPSVEICQSRPDNTVLPIHSDENGLGGSL